MKYYYKNPQGEEIGPIAYDVVVKLISQGEITRDTQIRNTMITSFNSAKHHHALTAAFNKAIQKPERQKNETEYEFQRRINKDYEKAIGEAPLATRIGSIVVDVLLLGALFAIIIFATFWIKWSDVAGSYEYKRNNFYSPTQYHAGAVTPWQVTGSQRFYASEKHHTFMVYNKNTEVAFLYRQDTFRQPLAVVSLVFGAIVVAYYVFGIGYFAQTLGMHFCGCMLAKHNPKAPQKYEITYKDAFFYFLAFITLGWSYIFTMWFTGFQGVHCLLARVRVASVASRPC